MGVVNGRAERFVHGVPREKNARYNPRLKTLCWKIGNQMIMANSPYRKIFDEARKKYQEKWRSPEDCGSPVCKKKGQHTEGHNVSAAKRKMVKIFLSHLWQKWREMEGLPIESPYIVGRDGHSHVYTPEEFVESGDKL